MIIKRAIAVSVAIIAIVPVAGCSGDHGADMSSSSRRLAETTDERGTVATTTATGVARARAIYRHLRGRYDYVSADSYAELANWSELVVSGTLSQISEGRIHLIDDIAESPSAVGTVEVNEVISGELLSSSTGRLYVELEDAYDVPAMNAAVGSGIEGV